MFGVRLFCESARYWSSVSESVKKSAIDSAYYLFKVVVGEFAFMHGCE